MIKRLATAIALTAGTAVLATGCSFSIGSENPLKPSKTPVAVETPEAPSSPQTQSTPEPTASTPSSRSTPSSTPRTSETPDSQPESKSGAVPSLTLEIKIANALRDQFGTSPVVECTEDLPARVGATVKCTADGTKLPGGHLNLEVEASEVVGNQVNFKFRQL